MTTATIDDAQIDAALARCPFTPTSAYAQSLALALGLEPVKGCWSEQVQAHGAELVRRVIERATTGDPALAACLMVRYGHATAVWACGVIERAKTGDPAWAAFCMVRDGHASAEWGRGVIERAKTGDPALAAYGMVLAGPATAEWAELVRQSQDKREGGTA